MPIRADPLHPSTSSRMGCAQVCPVDICSAHPSRFPLTAIASFHCESYFPPVLSLYVACSHVHSAAPERTILISQERVTINIQTLALCKCQNVPASVGPKGHKVSGSTSITNAHIPFASPDAVRDNFSSCSSLCACRRELWRLCTIVASHGKFISAPNANSIR